MKELCVTCELKRGGVLYILNRIRIVLLRSRKCLAYEYMLSIKVVP